MEPLRTCEVCGEELAGRRAGARTCSNKCRQADHRRRHPRADPRSKRTCDACGRPIPPHTVIRHHGRVVAVLTKDWHFTQPGIDRMLSSPDYQVEEQPRRIDAEYCSDACRQQAHRDRENQLDIGELAAVIDFLKRDRDVAPPS